MISPQILHGFNVNVLTNVVDGMLKLDIFSTDSRLISTFNLPISFNPYTGELLSLKPIGIEVELYAEFFNDDSQWLRQTKRAFYEDYPNTSDDVIINLLKDEFREEIIENIDISVDIIDINYSANYRTTMIDNISGSIDYDVKDNTDTVNTVDYYQIVKILESELDNEISITITDQKDIYKKDDDENK